jgi:sulfur carrier protein ThiS adenylyltransferase
MRILFNEREVEVPAGATLDGFRRQFKPDADLVIYNGFPLKTDHLLAEGDRVVLIRRGEHPPAEEMEALMVSRHTPGVHEKVRRATVGIAGAGGLGSSVAIALARVGVGHLIVADFDVVEPSNLNRQQYFIDQIGLPKVEALRENLARVNPYIRVTVFNGRLDRENIPLVFAEVDAMVEAFDAADQKAMLVETLLGAFPELPLVAASGLAGYAPSNTVRTRRAARNLYLVGDGATAARPGEGLMAPRVGIAAHHQANAVLRLLLGEEPD